MVKGSYILMDEKRQQEIELITSLQVATSKIFDVVRRENPLLAKFMMDKFKSFLNKNCFEAIERQSVLIQFLQDQADLTVVHEVLEFIDTACELKQDYFEIILEWTFHNGDSIRKFYLSKYDGVPLSSNVEETIVEEITINQEQNPEAFIDVILQIFNKIKGDPDDGGLSL